MNTSKSSALILRSLRSVWHPCTQMQHHETMPLIPIVRGKGAWLYDADGRRYLDAISSWWVNLFGHANDRINNSIKEQLDYLEHVMLAGFTHEPVVTLSEKLSALTSNALGHCFYASDGASAVEISLKMSAHAWRNIGYSKKQEFVCLQGSYHGETLGALGITDTSLFREAYEPLIRAAHVVPSPDSRQARDGQTPNDVLQHALDTLQSLLERRANHIAAVIVEPMVMCANSMAMYDASYLQGLRSLCNRYHVHLIADEIAVGCGRTGKFFACEQAGIWPDLLCLSKGISGGYLPLSLVMASADIYSAFYDTDLHRGFLHSHSYTGNPLACRAALATLSIFEEDNIIERNRVLAEYINVALQPLAQHPDFHHFRQQGMIWACDAIINDSENTRTFAHRFYTEATKQELLIRPIRKTVYLMPPYILDTEEIDILASRIKRVADNVMYGV
ncbi:adenosylmethionine--8-amino-7-oxononanoate transaminase [Candidatus Pandoraea novymonadis]|uniref:Adenosylmethionine-8-amino-7-oxononanoate aminotransferase n=1 Tax=Candidatus Pandoraea novymonadis TaxID=1808959 RepID=A0ABX5FGM1_9BURK|nr:adenosylmethionine--8-amino-7-oxononanoate transaminase [Candidatus Pandoraea novymonadis]PSB92117.1 Adenosylmethionine-8-amino-7-oxononanoate aminotransferase [Candidatus Pandoraea novymonadis]